MIKQRTREIWSWKQCKAKIRRLKGRLGFLNSSTLDFLQLSLSLENGAIHDNLRGCHLPEVAPNVYCILCGYADAEPVPETSRLISFRQLPGGNAYYQAFTKRVVLNLQKAYETNPTLLTETAKLLGGKEESYGNISARIPSLPKVPITVILWTGSSEFPASASMLFDASISQYLTTEQAAILGELTSIRLRHALQTIIEDHGFAEKVKPAENP